MSSQANRDEILYSFSVETDHGPDVLAKYVERFPDLSSELIELAWELNTSRFDEDEAAVEVADPRFEEALAELLSAVRSPQRPSDPFSRFRGQRFAEISQKLGVSRGFMIGIRDRRVREDSIPERFVSAASQFMEIAMEELRHYLREEPSVLGTAEFKADKKPTVTGQVSFRQLIEDTEMTEEQRSTALGYLEDVRSD